MGPSTSCWASRHPARTGQSSARRASRRVSHPTPIRRGREINVERIDSGTDLAVTSDRVGAYLSRNPETNAYFDTGFWAAGVARVMRDRGVDPGTVLMGAFDLVPEVLREMDAGYVQALVDQQPYAQGFLPVMQVYLADRDRAGARPTSTPAPGVVGPDDVAAIMEGSRQGLR